MITGALKSKIDKLWLEFWAGGITNPLTVIEQISFLMFARMLDMREIAAERRARRLERDDWERIFPSDKQHLRWSHLINLGAEEQLSIVQGEMFRFFREDIVKKSTLGK
jgi:type I restriction enzyme M protein